MRGDGGGGVQVLMPDLCLRPPMVPPVLSTTALENLELEDKQAFLREDYKV